MKEKRKIKFPKNFFQIVRPTVSNEETFKDVVSIKWKDNSKKVTVYSKNEKSK
jgi:hypothetical protein